MATTVLPTAIRTPASDRRAWAAVLADVAVVTVTPFVGAEARDVDHDGLARNLAHLLDNGVRLVVAGGNTGEFAALAPDELVAVVRTHVRAATGRARVIAGIGYRLDEAIALGRACAEAGADALMVHHPIHPYSGESGLIAYYEAIAAALPGVPLVLYVRGPQLTPEGIRRLAATDSIVGLKMGQPDVDRFAAFVEAAPELGWVCGLAETWAVPFHLAGAIGFTSGLANVAPRLSLDLHAALQAGDEAAALAIVDRVRPFEALRASRADAANVAAVKAALDLVGLVGGASRAPLGPLAADEHDRLVEILRDMEVSV
jgi:4-hydroxy-tetrahydrodipicolinate synthase